MSAKQNVAALETADYVIESGRCYIGTPEELLRSDHVKRAYLGVFSGR